MEPLRIDTSLSFDLLLRLLALPLFDDGVGENDDMLIFLQKRRSASSVYIETQDNGRD